MSAESRPTWNSAYLDLGPPVSRPTRISAHLDLGPPGTRPTWISAHLDLGPPGSRPTWISAHSICLSDYQGTEKAFPEVRGRALPPGVRKFIAKPAIPAVPAKPSATEVRTPSPLAVKTPLYASAPLKKPDEASIFRSKIPVRILASTTYRLDHQDHDISKGEDGQDLAANRARSAPRAKFVSRIPVRKVTIGRAHSITLPTQSYTVSAPVKADSLIVPEIHDVPQDGWREEMPLADFLVVVHQEPCSGDDQPGETAIQSGEIESEAATDSQLNSGTVPPPTRSQKRNNALRERRKANKRANLMANKVPSSAPTVDATLEDEQNPAACPVTLGTSDSDETSVASASVDAELILPNSENHQEKKKTLKHLEEGHPPFLPYVFVMDCLRPFVPQPTYEVKAEPKDEYLHVSNVPFSVPREEVVAYFQKLAGPVKFFSMHLNEDGVYSGKASIIFCRPDDARKALLLFDGTPLDGRKLKLKLFVDGERVYPNHVTLQVGLHLCTRLRDCCATFSLAVNPIQLALMVAEGHKLFALV
ncbi:hypothetical protein OUZ56_003595 [Daphnia magna]|uniref:RRM domain-containing protein n=1 Tax=Daphnia magna TaxID=35525 RepID=A0ABR0A9K4_9CRUS|nr:hypothetical protein OUZ56_003595 [Daphnia magna]